MAEEQTAYKKIRQIQVRIRENSTPPANTLPQEDNQFLVFLEGEDGWYFVPFKGVTDRAMEFEMAGLIREAFMQEKHVKLAYYLSNGLRYISAVWVTD